jgi:L-ascorbate metabolism protein UlaG (beta-lactamase superfamily)
MPLHRTLATLKAGGEYTRFRPRNQGLAKLEIPLFSVRISLMNISWYGHRCIRLEAKEGNILIDPYDPKEIGLRGPSSKDDIILMSAYHQPSALVGRFTDGAFVIRGPGEYEQKGIAIRGIQAFQDSVRGKELGLCSIYAVVADELSVCHLGALGQETLTDEQLEAIGDPDILIIPVGGQSALDPKAAAALATQIEPKVIIPIQFAITGASYEAEKAEKFVKEIGLPVQNVETFRIQKKQLPVDQTALVVLSS